MYKKFESNITKKYREYENTIQYCVIERSWFWHRSNLAIFFHSRTSVILGWGYKYLGFFFLISSAHWVTNKFPLLLQMFSISNRFLMSILCTCLKFCRPDVPFQKVVQRSLVTKAFWTPGLRNTCELNPT